MKTFRSLAGSLLLGGFLAASISASAATNSPTELFANGLLKIVQAFRTQTGDTSQTFTAGIRIHKADGIYPALAGHEGTLAFQAPDLLRVTTRWDNTDYSAGRNHQELWAHLPEKKFGLIGTPDAPLFVTAPDRKSTKPLGPIEIGFPPEQIMMLPLVMKLNPLPDETISGSRCYVFTATATPEAVRGFKLLPGTFTCWVRVSDSMPMRLAYREGSSRNLEVEFVDPKFVKSWPAEKWKLAPNPGDHIDTVARVHLTRFMSAAIELAGEKIPTLGPETGEHRVLAREGDGHLDLVDGTRVLYMKGTPEEMGRQHGRLLSKEIGKLVDEILYGVGVGSTFEKGRWFLGEIESAQSKLVAHMDSRYLQEMDAIADAARLPREEVRLANYFPELFHCSGFALFGQATENGAMFHGRVLDYLRGLGLEQNAVVMVFQPDQGNAWVNVGYAGFVGSVTAMNEKHISIGEMGGRGEGHWDGKPMAQLVREVMEKANTLDEALAILRKGPRTCEYYYVVADGKTKTAAGIAATPEKFEVIRPGETHPLLSHAFNDTVLMSAGDRYEELANRVKTGYGKFNAERARDLMKRPVCMTSNIHCALFEPDTLDFWVANADSTSPAAHTRFTHYNLATMLQAERSPTGAALNAKQR